MPSGSDASPLRVVGRGFMVARRPDDGRDAESGRLADPELPESLLRTGADAYDFFGARLAAGDAAIRVAHLDAGNRVIGMSIHDASLNAADLPIQSILREALSCDGAALVLAQNRPTGPATPSDADIDATRRLAEAARRLGIRVLDRLLFTAGGCDSFRQLGLL